jgi:putative transposase
MPRQLRFVVPGVPMHIMQRGVNKGRCFGDDADRLMFLGLLEQHAMKSGCDIHAYVLMTNHIHVLATPASENAPALMMKRVLEVYSSHYNRKYDRCGALWGGRYKSSLVDTSTYLLRCYRYIDLNPVRGGLASAPHLYRWSSFAHNGFAQPAAWIVPHPVYSAMGRTREACAEAYRKFVDEGVSSEELQTFRVAIRGGVPVGSEEFVRQMSGEPAEG